MADENNKLAVSHKDRFPPEMFENNTFDLMKRGADLGLDPEAVKVLNRERYLRNLKLLEEDGMMLEIMPIQTTEMILTALYQNPDAFIHVTNQNEEVCEYVLRKKSEMLEFIKEQTEQQISYAIKKNPWNVNHVHEPQTHHFVLAIETNYHVWSSIDAKHRNDEILKAGIVSSTHEYRSAGQNRSQYDSILQFLTIDDFTPEIVEFALNEGVDNLKHIPYKVNVSLKWAHAYAEKYPQNITSIRGHIDRETIIIALNARKDYWGEESLKDTMRCFDSDRPLTEEYVRKIRNMNHVTVTHRIFNVAQDNGLLQRKDIIKDIFNGEIYLSDIQKWDIDIIIWAMKYSDYSARKEMKSRSRFNFFANPRNRFISFLSRLKFI